MAEAPTSSGRRGIRLRIILLSLLVISAVFLYSGIALIHKDNGDNRYYVTSSFDDFAVPDGLVPSFWQQSNATLVRSVAQDKGESQTNSENTEQSTKTQTIPDSYNLEQDPRSNLPFPAPSSAAKVTPSVPEQNLTFSNNDFPAAPKHPNDPKVDETSTGNSHNHSDISDLHGGKKASTSPQLNEAPANNHSKKLPLRIQPLMYDQANPPKDSSSIQEFTKQPGVVIATKLHGSVHFRMAEQSLCLLHHAYNNRVLYDIVVFVTEALLPEEIEQLQGLVAPAKLSVVVDNRGSLGQEIEALSPIRKEKFWERCKAKNPQLSSWDEITWFTECPGRVAYNWQAEFRSWHIWNHPAIAEYKYMLWMDTDGFCTKPWEKDPIAYMLQNDLVILFDNFPQGQASQKVHPRVQKAFQTNICDLDLVDGKLQTRLHPEECGKRNIRDIHGFFHITNMEFYRSQPVIQWAETLIGDCFLCREYDDQVAVTVPAAILAPNRSHDMRENGMKLDVYHNTMLDGKKWDKAGGFKKFWRTQGKKRLPTAANVCPVTVAG